MPHIDPNENSITPHSNNGMSLPEPDHDELAEIAGASGTTITVERDASWTREHPDGTKDTFNYSDRTTYYPSGKIDSEGDHDDDDYLDGGEF